MADGAHIAIHASEDVVIAGVGMSGVDEALHRFDGVVLLAEQFAIVVAGMGVLVRTEQRPLFQGLIGLRELCAVGIGLSGMPETVRLLHSLFRFTAGMRCTSREAA